MKNAVEVAMTLFRKVGGELLLQDAGKAINVTERSTKIVRNGIAKGFHFVRGANQFSCPIRYTLLERGIQSRDFCFPAAQIGDVEIYANHTDQLAIGIEQEFCAGSN